MTAQHTVTRSLRALLLAVGLVLLAGVLVTFLTNPGGRLTGNAMADVVEDPMPPRPPVTASTTTSSTTTTEAPPTTAPRVAAASASRPAPAPSPPPPPPPAPPAPPAPAAPGLTASPAAEAEVLSYINARRAENGLPAVQRNGCLDGIARSWSFDMARRGEPAHNPSSASQAGSCVSWRSAGEVVGYASSAARVNQMWWESSSHRSTILGSFSQVGIGAVWDGSSMWITVDFVG